ncbi:uncharacterized protein LOC133348678 isoform X1 [Lethenteron reissneri]|uniref:uncharacterized protein LOC133348678 isoform X1 n=1 Tax=Lethenteron reissneri TaxID=7753 RepID=UPI002AB6D17F|nr:uncharacterized protein LOC133348678 isoform X1 [Lethenteron reissneri]XP_061417604.1 uncharacterized protein LOC133348678 isoform X1 [Lethenteron reissneri]
MESRDHGLDHLMSITMATVAMMIMVVMATAGVKVMDACDEKTDETLSVHYGESVLLNCSLPPEHKERHLKSVHWKKKTPNTQSINLLYYEESMRKLDTPSGITLVGNPSAGDGSLVFNMSEVDRAGVYWCELKAKVGMESRFSKKICVTVREASLPVSTTVATVPQLEWVEMAAFIAGSVVLFVILVVLAAWGYHRNQQRIMERFINRASVQTTGPYENFQPSKPRATNGRPSLSTIGMASAQQSSKSVVIRTDEQNFQEACIYDNET